MISKDKLIKYFKPTAILYLSNSIGLAFELLLSFVAVRRFSSSSFASLGVFSSVINIYFQFVTLKFDHKLPYCDQKNDACQLFVLAIISAFLISLASLFVLPFLAFIETPSYLISLGAFMLGANTALYSLCVFFKDFIGCFLNLPIKNLVNLLVILFIANESKNLLIIATILGLFGANLAMGLRVLPRLRGASLARSSLITKARENAKYPSSVVFGAIFFALGQNLPGIIIPSVFGEENASFFCNIVRLLSAPITILGISSSQLLLKFCSGQKSKAKIREIARKFSIFLILISALSYGGIYGFRGFLAKKFIPKGDELSKELFGILCLYFAFKLVCGVIIAILPIINEEKLLRRWQEGLFLFNLLLFLVFKHKRLEFRFYILALCLGSISLYSLIYILTIKKSRKRPC